MAASVSASLTRHLSDDVCVAAGWKMMTTLIAHLSSSVAVLAELSDVAGAVNVTVNDCMIV